MSKTHKKWWHFSPPFDFFGINPTFFINGDDKTVTWIGFFCIVGFLSILLVVSLIFFISFFKEGKTDLYISNLILSASPVLSLQEKKFLLIIKHNYPVTGPFHGLQDKFFSIRFHQNSQSPDTPNPYEMKRNPRPLVPCEDIKMDISDVNYSPELI